MMDYLERHRYTRCQMMVTHTNLLIFQNDNSVLTNKVYKIIRNKIAISWISLSCQVALVTKWAPKLSFNVQQLRLAALTSLGKRRNQLNHQ